MRKLKSLLRTYTANPYSSFWRLGGVFSMWERSAVRFIVLVQSITFLLLLCWLRKLTEYTYFCITKGPSAPTWFVSFLSEVSDKCCTLQMFCFLSSLVLYWAFIVWLQAKVFALRKQHICKRKGLLSYGPDLVIIK